ncbi:MAG: hypothetical protein HY203_09860 [Nitrospirae bacterium]|nr:hypothetical protein [Nitrospirota bacterium]
MIIAWDGLLGETMSFISQILFGLLAVLSFHPTIHSYAEDNTQKSITAEDGEYRAILTGAGEPWFDPKTGGRVKFTFSVTDIINNRQYPVYLDNVTAKVFNLSIFQGKLIVMGEEANLHSPVTTLIDLKNREEADSFIGFGNTQSPTGRFLSYRKFYPPQTAEPPVMSDLVLVYDLADSAAGNRMRGEDAYRNDPIGWLTEVGHPIYPESNAGKKHYRVWVPEENKRHTIIPNGFFWFDHDRKIAFGDQIGDEDYVVVVDLSSGLTQPVIHRMEIDLRSLLRPEDRENATILHEAKPLKLESVQDLKNGKIEVRISSRVPLRDNRLEFPFEETAPAASKQTQESAQPTHGPQR